MNYRKEFKDYALIDLKQAKNEVKKLFKKLDIDEKTIIPYDDLVSVYLVNFNINLYVGKLLEQFKENGNKNIILQYKYNSFDTGKRELKTVYVKSFGRLNTISKEKFMNIWNLVSLLRSIHQLNLLMSTVGSFYRLENAVENLYDNS